MRLVGEEAGSAAVRRQWRAAEDREGRGAKGVRNVQLGRVERLVDRLFVSCQFD